MSTRGTYVNPFGNLRKKHLAVPPSREADSLQVSGGCSPEQGYSER